MGEKFGVRIVVIFVCMLGGDRRVLELRDAVTRRIYFIFALDVFIYIYIFTYTIHPSRHSSHLFVTS